MAYDNITVVSNYVELWELQLQLQLQLWELWELELWELELWGYTYSCSYTYSYR